MKYYCNQTPVESFHKYNCIQGVYRILTVQHYDLLEGFFYQVTFTDGSKKISMNTSYESTDRLNFDVGAFVFIEAVRDSNANLKIIECKVVSSEIALDALGFRFDSTPLIANTNFTINEVLDEVKSDKLRQLVKHAKALFLGRFKEGFTISLVLKRALRRFANNIARVEFETSDDRDYAIVFGLVYAVFIDTVGPSKRFDMRIKEHILYLDLSTDLVTFLERHFPELSATASEVLFKTDPLVRSVGELSNNAFIKAIQVVSAQDIQCYDRVLLNNIDAA